MAANEVLILRRTEKLGEDGSDLPEMLLAVLRARSNGHLLSSDCLRNRFYLRVSRHSKTWHAMRWESRWPSF